MTRARLVLAAACTLLLSLPMPAQAAAVPAPIVPAPQKSITVNELTSFSSPSGNIGCYIEPDSVRCDVRERSWAPPPKPASCPDVVGWGQGLELRVGRPADFVCAGDTALTNDNPLAYGDTIVAGEIECTSAASGVTCWDIQYGGEFTISREAYRLG